MSKKNRPRTDTGSYPTMTGIPSVEQLAAHEAYGPDRQRDTDAIERAKHAADFLIAVPTFPEHNEIADACRATWAKTPDRYLSNHVVDIVFFDAKTLGVPEGYALLPLKVQAICRWALERGYQWMTKLDDDTFCWVERLLASGFEKWDYTGYTNPKMQDSQNYCSGGAGYTLSKRAMKVISEATLPEDTCEDRVVGRLLYDAGIKLHRDDRYAHGRHDEAGEGRLLTMHPCSNLQWMQRMQNA